MLGRLGISHEQLKKHLNRENSNQQPKVEDQSHKSECCGFIECKLPLDKMIPTDNIHCCDIELKKPNGTTLLIKMADEVLLSSLIRSFIE